MSVKERILKDIQGIESPRALNQLYDYLQLVKQANANPVSNRDAVLSHAGSISDAEAKEMLKIIDEEFNHIEGEW